MGMMMYVAELCRFVPADFWTYGTVGSQCVGRLHFWTSGLVGSQCAGREGCPGCAAVWSCVETGLSPLHEIYARNRVSDGRRATAVVRDCCKTLVALPGSTNRPACAGLLVATPNSDPRPMYPAMEDSICENRSRFTPGYQHARSCGPVVRPW